MGTKWLSSEGLSIDSAQKSFNGKNFRRIAYVNWRLTPKLRFNKICFQ